ncbi:hypothetical protein SUGI_0303450 [Cryptomeria japonica]|uniref:xylan glycosyltransferase MUCI21 n=1 Tax=Cryptomeria japonica TaxID=3369 RepID=UPI00240897AA|nr:xylan glycosyltransferase MUCI21 [Cryptomeria japonica]XP_057822349.2 xylan glycosyltransferase MUCI21 [Cryptomeria japonica]GLJ17437.1 hypothetical protein SUGI_0303450 [Cryptomeria japonica]
MGFSNNADANYTKAMKRLKGSSNTECKKSNWHKKIAWEMKKLRFMGTAIFPGEKKWRNIHFIIITTVFLCVAGCAMALLKFLPSAAAVAREGSNGLMMMLGEGKSTGNEEQYYSSTEIEKPHQGAQRSHTDSTLFCDRSSYRTDICILKGDIRTDSATNTVFLVSDKAAQEEEDQKLKPYTRKWENYTMSSVTEISLKTIKPSVAPRCHVIHTAPALVFSTGGYTGNLFHDFTDVIVPLFVTVHHFNSRPVFLVVDHKDWWISKFQEILNQLTPYPLLDFQNDTRVHCFTKAIVGLRFHGDLRVDPATAPYQIKITDFQNMLQNAYGFAKKRKYFFARPKFVLIARKGSRAFLNQRKIVNLAEKLGFRVMVLFPDRDTKLKDMYEIVSSCDVFMGVHGAALTHFLFLRPGAVFIQVVPLGIEWASRTFFREPAMDMTGIHYLEYSILPEESSLFDEYPKDHVYLTNPKVVNDKGWDATKEIYLDRQNVKIDLERLKKMLKTAMDLLQSKGHVNNA